MPTHDPYFKKTISYNFLGKKLLFNVSQDLFSSNAVDVGTQRLLRTLEPEYLKTIKKVLDIGCGYGPIGTAIKAINPESIVHMVDRDALALEYSRQNALLNKVSSENIYGSLGLQEVKEKDFDLIISNVPAKVGSEVLKEFLLKPKKFLTDKGRVVIVVIEAILQETLNILEASEQVEILLQKSWPGHTVIHYRFNENNSVVNFEVNPYERTHMSFTIKENLYRITTAYNLPEFDTLDHKTELLLNSLASIKIPKKQKIAIYNPNQGHIPLAINEFYSPVELTLVDRNLQALQTSQQNLLENQSGELNIRLVHTAYINEMNSGAVIACFEDKEIRPVYLDVTKRLIGSIDPKGMLVVVARSKTLSDIESALKKNKSITLVKKIRGKGNGILVGMKK